MEVRFITNVLKWNIGQYTLVMMEVTEDQNNLIKNTTKIYEYIWKQHI